MYQVWPESRADASTLTFDEKAAAETSKRHDGVSQARSEAWQLQVEQAVQARRAESVHDVGQSDPRSCEPSRFARLLCIILEQARRIGHSCSRILPTTVTHFITIVAVIQVRPPLVLTSIVSLKTSKPAGHLPTNIASKVFKTLRRGACLRGASSSGSRGRGRSTRRSARHRAQVGRLSEGLIKTFTINTTLLLT